MTTVAVNIGSQYYPTNSQSPDGRVDPSRESRYPLFVSYDLLSKCLAETTFKCSFFADIICLETRKRRENKFEETEDATEPLFFLRSYESQQIPEPNRENVTNLGRKRK